ncbi:MAG: M1 family metallopeptidase [Acidobacteriota bacterium]|nr:M1 family metallopeptidase [Acidobacteriota bacterium]
MGRMDPHSYTDPDQARTRHIDLEWTVDFESRRLRGVARLDFVEAGTGPVDLDTKDLDIEAVESGDGRPLDFSLAPAEGFMGARLRVERPEKVDSIRIRYGTSPGASALQWLEPQHTAGGAHPYMFSQCQPIHARSMVPLQDSARVRFSYSARITVPRPLKVVMSAAPGEETRGETTSVFSFEMPQPIPSYLLAIAVGNLASRDLGPRSRVYAEPEQLDAAAWEFAEIDRMLLAAEDLFGPYRWDRFDFVVMPPAFPYGGMENPRLTFLTPTLLAGDRSLVNVLAHELAHSWTGNLVTNATMNDFWLNEGFTVWAERRILESLAGDDAVALAAAIGRHGLEEDIQRFGEDSPFTRLENDLEGIDPDEIYSQVPYEKGCLLVQLVEKTVGREVFDRFITRYMDRFAFTSITTAEFEAFFREALPGVAEKIGMEEWIRGTGIPANAPTFHSPQLEEITALAAGWSDGDRPDPQVARQWSAELWQIYLQRLPRPISHEQCEWFDQTFSLTDSGNCEILCQWLLIAAASAWEPAYPKIRSFLGSVGRMKYLKPLYTTLHKGEKTRAMAAELFAAYGDRYHPIARGGLELILKS